MVLSEIDTAVPPGKRICLHELLDAPAEEQIAEHVARRGAEATPFSQFPQRGMFPVVQPHLHSLRQDWVDRPLWLVSRVFAEVALRPSGLYPRVAVFLFAHEVAH